VREKKLIYSGCVGEEWFGEESDQDQRMIDSDRAGEVYVQKLQYCWADLEERTLADT
jgi:hypothetical protein